MKIITLLGATAIVAIVAISGCSPAPSPVQEKSQSLGERALLS
jgi:hypothetical protein